MWGQLAEGLRFEGAHEAAVTTVARAVPSDGLTGAWGSASHIARADAGFGQEVLVLQHVDLSVELLGCSHDTWQASRRAGLPLATQVSPSPCGRDHMGTGPPGSGGTILGAICKLATAGDIRFIVISENIAVS